jgi:competence protein ComEA
MKHLLLLYILDVAFRNNQESTMKSVLRFVLVTVLTLITSAVMAEPVNVNTANAEEIAQALNGIGEAKARAIVEFREANGPFQSVHDLTEVKGIGSKTLEMNKDDIQL